MDTSKLLKQIEAELGKVSTDADCGAFHQKYLGKNGEITKLLQSLKDIEPAKRAEAGAAINNLKKLTESKLFALQDKLKEKAIHEKLMQDPIIDITNPLLAREVGRAWEGTAHFWK